MSLTLRKIHTELEIKQNIEIYVRNTNKKYGTTLLADEELDKAMYLLIRLNTLGKLRHHSQQMHFLADYLRTKETNAVLNQENQKMAGQIEKAQELIKKDNLKDAYIEFLAAKTELSLWNYRRDEHHNALITYMEKSGIKYAEWIDEEGVQIFLDEREEWFVKELAK